MPPSLSSALTRVSPYVPTPPQPKAHKSRTNKRAPSAVKRAPTPNKPKARVAHKTPKVAPPTPVVDNPSEPREKEIDVKPLNDLVAPTINSSYNYLRGDERAAYGKMFPTGRTKKKTYEEPQLLDKRPFCASHNKLFLNFSGWSSHMRQTHKRALEEITPEVMWAEARVSALQEEKHSPLARPKKLPVLSEAQKERYMRSPLAKVLSPEELYIIDERIQSGKLTANSPEIRQLIVKRFEDDILAFGMHILADHFTDKATNTVTEPPAFHKELQELLQTQSFLAIAAPRGHAKSTIVSFLYVLHSILYKKKKFAVIISASEEMAKKFLRRIKDELEFNELILWLFGEQKTEKWSETEIKLHDGGVIIAKGRGAQLRGLISGSSRPDLIICDDIEDDELVRSELRRQDLEEWFNGAVFPTLEPKTGQLVFIGTVLHMDSLLNRLLTNTLYPDFTTRRFAALTPENEPLWPERFSKEKLEKVKASFMSRFQLHKFFMEYMNDPVPVESALFQQEFIQYFNDIPEPSTSVFSIDLGGAGVTKGADPTAIVVLTSDQRNSLYVNDYVNERFGSDNQRFFNALFELYFKYRPHTVYIEDTISAKMLKPHLEAEMRHRGIFFNIVYVMPQKGAAGSHRIGTASEGKFLRIGSLSDPFKAGALKIRPWMRDLVEQLLVFPRGAHDDIIDALAHGYQQIKTRMFVQEVRSREGGESEYTPLYDEINM